LRLIGGQRVTPHAIETAFRIDVPERIERSLLQPVGLRAGIDRPDMNQPAFLMVPSGFSRISSSFLGMSCGIPWAWPEFIDNNSCGKTDTASSIIRMRLIVFSPIVKHFSGALCAQARRGDRMNNRNRDLYPKIGFS
jgi:hypothetical protein